MRFSNLACMGFLAHLILAAPAPAIEYVTKTHVVYVHPDGAIVGTSFADAGAAATTTELAIPAEITLTTSAPPTAVPDSRAQANAATAPVVPAPTQSTSTPAPTGGSGNFQGDGTYFDPGLGACGLTNSAGDYIVAISDELYSSSMVDANPNNNPVCGKKLRATYEGKSVEVTVVDRCMGCQGKYDLDLSPVAFEAIADKALGRIKLSWDWI